MPAWTVPLGIPALGESDLHVWRVTREQPEAVVASLHATLSVDERMRVDRFRFERDRRRYIIGRGVLRVIIGEYLNFAPERLVFNYGPKGKPALSLPVGYGQLHFNLAHSHELALYAFTRQQPVGIDVEYTQRVVGDQDRLAARFFSVRENEMYHSLLAVEKRSAFFRCWTRKEAFIKAIGDGLSYPLDRFDVTLTPDQPPAFLAIEGDSEAARRWSLFHLEPDPDYVGAVAIEGNAWQLEHWVWSSNLFVR
jgi:4'-phosphopantetheinyl transferase